jgi:hypothetical protein
MKKSELVGCQTTIHHWSWDFPSCPCSPGWPDAFVKKIAQNVAQPILTQKYYITVEKVAKVWVNTVPDYKNSPA